MTARSTQAATLVLAEKKSNPRVSQVVVQVLWGIGSTATATQVAMQVLGRAPVRRTIGITD